MAQLSAEEMANIWGSLGYRNAFDSCDDPDGSEIYAHWNVQDAYEAYLDYAMAAQYALTLAYEQYAALGNRASTPEQARQQAEACKIDPLFVNMMNSPSFKLKELTLMASANANMIEYGLNYYGADNFGDIFTKRLPDRITINIFDLSHLAYGKADVFIHTHQGPDVKQGLSIDPGDIHTAKYFNIGIMAIDLSNSQQPAYYCYNPNSEKPVL